MGLQTQDASLKEEKFSKPYLFQAQLPMDHYLFKVTTPKRYLANHLDNEYGFPLVTYSNGDFSRVRLNEHGMVEEIVIVTKKVGRPEVFFYHVKHLWGISKRLGKYCDVFALWERYQ